MNITFYHSNDEDNNDVGEPFCVVSYFDDTFWSSSRAHRLHNDSDDNSGTGIIFAYKTVSRDVSCTTARFETWCFSFLASLVFRVLQIRILNSSLIVLGSIFK